MEFIIFITENQELSESNFNPKLNNLSLIIINDIKNIEAIIHEYMPKYILISDQIKEYPRIIKYIQNNTSSELIITGKTGMPFTGLCVDEIKNKGELRRILELIDNLEEKEDRFQIVKQQVTALYSVQGGVGKTSMAFNIAFFLSRLQNAKILLIDLNFCDGQGDIGGRLEMPVLPNLGVFIESPENSPFSLWESVISLKSLNIDILQPPVSISQSDNFDVNMLNELIYSARTKYGYIICDLPNGYDNHVLETLNLSTSSILLLTPDRVAAKRANRFKKFLPQNQKKFAVLNKVSKGYTQNELNKILDMPIDGEISFIDTKRDLHGFLDMQSEVSKLREMFI